MTSINNSTPAMLSYYGSQLNNRSTASSGEADGQASQDPVADLRRFAKQVVARSEGGLLRAMNGGAAQLAIPCSAVVTVSRLRLR